MNLSSLTRPRKPKSPIGPSQAQNFQDKLAWLSPMTTLFLCEYRELLLSLQISHFEHLTTERNRETSAW